MDRPFEDLIELSPLPTGGYLIGRADDRVAISKVLLTQLLGECAGNRDGLIVFSGVDAEGRPREVAYREVGFDRTSAPEMNDGGFHLLERVH